MLMRKFYRHATDIPIGLGTRRLAAPATSSLINVGAGGICCKVDTFLPIGTSMDLSIPARNPIFEGAGVVCWCRGDEACGFEVGLSFCDSDEAFRVRMVEQVCRIERYKAEMLECEGRRLSPDVAAAEWIEKYAAAFAEDFQEG